MDGHYLSMPITRLAANLCAGVILLFCVVPPVSAEIYRYRDERGVWHFTNIKSDRRYKLYLGKPSGGKSGHTGKTDLDGLEEIIHLAARQFQVDSSLIKAIIKAETDFDHRAVSRKGAKGLMQLMPDTAREMGVKDPLDPEQNILGGTRYLSLLLKRFNDNKTLAIAAYNAGPEEVASRRAVPPFPETRKFVKNVMNYYREFRAASSTNPEVGRKRTF